MQLLEQTSRLPEECFWTNIQILDSYVYKEKCSALRYVKVLPCVHACF